ncbi:MAG TPA: PASTA domain-containing protein [Gemmatimonadales bacterium]|nr:PASTA domain-containing protein [Gemmatimonadales bacterium]
MFGKPAGAAPPPGDAGKPPAPPDARDDRPAHPVRRFVFLIAGVAATALLGYLLAALLLFPAPLLPNERQVPRLIGATAAQAELMLAQNGLRSEIADRERHPTLAAGMVSWQDPAPGVAVPRGTVVALTVSEGPPRVAVPDVRALDPDLAQQLLAAAGISVAAVDTVASQLTVGLAVGTAPAAGDSVQVGRAVILHLSRGTK